MNISKKRVIPDCVMRLGDVEFWPVSEEIIRGRNGEICQKNVKYAIHAFEVPGWNNTAVVKFDFSCNALWCSFGIAKTYYDGKLAYNSYVYKQPPTSLDWETRKDVDVITIDVAYYSNQAGFY